MILVSLNTIATLRLLCSCAIIRNGHRYLNKLVLQLLHLNHLAEISFCFYRKRGIWLVRLLVCYWLVDDLAVSFPPNAALHILARPFQLLTTP